MAPNSFLYVALFVPCVYSFTKPKHLIHMDEPLQMVTVVERLTVLSQGLCKINHLGDKAGDGGRGTDCVGMRRTVYTFE